MTQNTAISEIPESSQLIYKRQHLGLYLWIFVIIIIIEFTYVSFPEYAQVTKMLGNGRLEAMCFDGVKRLCHIRGKLRKKVTCMIV